MAKVIQKYASEDGKEFNTELECEAYESAIKNKGLIDAYVAKVGLVKAQATLVSRHLAQFIAFEAGYEPPPEAPAAPEVPADEQPATEQA